MGRRRGRFQLVAVRAAAGRWARPARARRRHLLRPLRPRPARGPGMSREAMLGAIRRSLRRGPLPEDLALGLRARLAAHPRQLVPARSRLPRPEQVACSSQRWSRSSPPACVCRPRRRCPARSPISRRAEPAERVRDGAASGVERTLPWDAHPLLRLREGRGERSDTVSVQHGYAGMAETGTLMLPTGPERPATLNLLRRRRSSCCARAAWWAPMRRPGTGCAAEGNGGDAARRHVGDGSVALGRHRVDAGTWRARPAPAARSAGGR